jgi:hypothetical protein
LDDLKEFVGVCCIGDAEWVVVDVEEIEVEIFVAFCIEDDTVGIEPRLLLIFSCS